MQRSGWQLQLPPSPRFLFQLGGCREHKLNILNWIQCQCLSSEEAKHVVGAEQDGEGCEGAEREEKGLGQVELHDDVEVVSFYEAQF